MDLKLVDRKEEVPGVKSFFWEAEKPLSYLPGQYFIFTLPQLLYPDTRGEIREFTLSSAPSESDRTVRFTTRIRPESGYKTTLDEMELGNMIYSDGPHGDFTFDQNDATPRIFLAGGIGITPFRSMIKYVYDLGLTHQIYLLYSVALSNEFVFMDELDEIAHQRPNIKVVYTVTQPENNPSPWSGLTGRIDAGMITNLITNNALQAPSYWICGPETMVTGMQDILTQLNVSADKIHLDAFPGY